MTKPLEGRVAIVAGAGHEIGRATALRLAGEGALVVATDTEPSGLSQTSSIIEAQCGTSIAVAADLRSDASVGSVIDRALGWFGRIDILINDSGSIHPAPFHRWSQEVLVGTFDQSVLPSIRLTRAALDHIRSVAMEELAHEGVVRYQRKIVFTASAPYWSRTHGYTRAAAACGALLALTNSLAVEVGAFGINVNAVVPGLIRDQRPDPRYQMARGSGTNVDELLSATALRRTGTPEDVAAAHCFLAGPDSDFITGSHLNVTGGYVGARMPSDQQLTATNGGTHC